MSPPRNMTESRGCGDWSYRSSFALHRESQ
jgi:hypothetical protein